jgi:hypothetical protein
MAQSFQTAAVNFTTPGARVDLKVQTPNSGLSTTGILMLVGEADQGPDVSAETDITQNGFGPDALASVVAKYGSGNIVDAFRTAAAAANDPNIQGAPSKIFIAKTNISTKASGALQRAGLASAYGTLADKNYGLPGNLINAVVTAGVSEVAPTTGTFTYIPTPSTSTLGLRVNGGSNLSVTVSAKMAPSTLVGTVSSGSGLSLNSVTVSGLNVTHATGGQNRGVLTAAEVASGQTLAVAAPGSNVIVITLSSGSWPVTPSVGDTLIIPNNGDYGAGANSAIAGAGNANRGAYVVTAATSSTITATKLRNDIAGVLTAPVAVVATDILAITDFICYSPIELQNMTGTERTILTGLVGQTITGSASGQQLTLTLQTGAQWAALPQAGDRLLIPSTAPANWLASGANAGWFQVTSATTGVGAGASTIVMTRLSNGAPASFAATAIAALTDFRVIRPAIDGVGKALEIFDGGGAESITTQLFALSTTAVSWVSSAGSPKILVSASEYSSTLTVGRQSDALSEALTGPSDVVLRVGYHGGGATTVTGSLTISGTTLTTTVTNGNGANLSINLLNYKTLGDLATYINSQPGYVCSVASTLFGQMALNVQDATTLAFRTVLDKGTWGIASHNIGAAATVSPAGRIKRDAYALWVKLQNSLLTQLGTTVSAPASAGQPEAQALFFLSGGAKGSTSNANVVTAIDAMEKVRGNFLVPLFSRDATADAADSLTDSGSTYTIDSINAYAKTHVLAMSGVKRRRNRQAFLSYRGSFSSAKLAANNIASARCAMTFEDFKTVDSTGSIKQFQPWMGAVYAAAMQAAGFYKPIVKKFINCSGVLMADGSFSDQLDSQVEDALLNGLLPAERAETGGFRWVSDQTTYAVDSNFVYNSIQAVYVADTIALTIAQRMENAFVGQSLADISAGLMLSFLTTVMIDIKRLRLITSSDDAPLGFKDATVKISGPAAEISLNIKLAGALYFIPITAYISQVTQTASQ